MSQNWYVTIKIDCIMRIKNKLTMNSKWSSLAMRGMEEESLDGSLGSSILEMFVLWWKMMCYVIILDYICSDLFFNFMIYYYNSENKW
jgi:hypothetical protein